MKTRTKITNLAGIISFAALAALCPLQAFAVDAEAGPQGGVGKGTERAKWFQRGFGRWLANHPEYKEKYDVNKDGKLDPAEKKEAKKAWEDEKSDKWLTKHPKAAEKWDANKDGVLDETEKQEAQKHWNERHKWKWQRDAADHPHGHKGGKKGGPNR